MLFEFATATRIIFGAGSLKDIGNIAKSFGQRAFIATPKTVERAEPLLTLLKESGVAVVTFPIDGEPTIPMIQAAVEQARAENCDLVIGFGGGSAVDAGKAIAALATNPGDPLDYLEVIGQGNPLANPPLPYIAIPTTSGTGAEVTRNAVLKSEENNVKVSLRSALMLPRVALVDPELALSAPADVTASTGMDALTQVIEPYVSNKANPLTDAICVEGMRRAARSLQGAYEDGDDVDARSDMAIVSLFSGLALANAKLGAAHGFAGPMGGMYPIPHGTVCARLLPYVVEMNVRALQSREPDNPLLKRFDEVARILTGDPAAMAQDGVEWTARIGETLKIPGLAAYGVKPDDFPTIVEKSERASSMKGNPITLTPAELTEILERAI
jgi:alcohol dehydrogenase class IV